MGLLLGGERFVCILGFAAGDGVVGDAIPTVIGGIVDIGDGSGVDAGDISLALYR